MDEKRIVVVALGDSITAGTPGWDPNPTVRRTISPDVLDERHQWPYWAERLDPRLAIENRGVNGERTDEISRRLERVPRDAGAIVLQGGINDIAQAREPEAAAANIRAMVARSKQLVPFVAVADVLPWNRGYPDHDAAIRRLNELVAEIAFENGVPLLPFFAELEDPVLPGRMRAECTGDGNHPSLHGHRRLGFRTASILGGAL